MVKIKYVEKGYIPKTGERGYVVRNEDEKRKHLEYARTAVGGFSGKTGFLHWARYGTLEPLLYDAWMLYWEDKPLENEFGPVTP